MKSLKDILNGVKKSKVVDASTGDDPGVDYAPSAEGEKKFIAKHKIEKHADRVGNDEVPYKASNKQAPMKNHGHAAPKDSKVYEEVEPIEEISRTKVVDAVLKAADENGGSTGVADKRKKLLALADKKLWGKPKVKATKEEVEPIEEISKETLSSYKDKASEEESKSRAKAKSLRAVASSESDPKKSRKAQADSEAADIKTNKRRWGVSAAVHKIYGGNKLGKIAPYKRTDDEEEK